MRLKPVAPILALQAVRDTVVANLFVPAGTLVMCLMRPGAVREEHFAGAQSFKPERWLIDGHADAAGSSVKRMVMSFGSGPRICPGRYLALQQMKMVIGMLLGNFDVGNVSTPDGAEAQERLAFTMAPVGLRLKLRGRAQV